MLEYTKPEGPHPLEVQKLCPFYVWLIFAASFFMLIAANGMSALYRGLANGSSALSDFDTSYQMEKVSEGLFFVIVLILATKVLDKVYYRERLIPNPFFNWLDMFYKKAAVDDKSYRASRVLSSSSSSHNNLHKDHHQDSNRSTTVSIDSNSAVEDSSLISKVSVTGSRYSNSAVFY
jgi:hypothetical protein